VRPGSVHRIMWLLACTWCVIGWTAPVQASWEEYQQAGEAAYDQGHYTEAERLFLAAVREARHFGPHDPRLDISVNKLALIRVIRSQSSTVGPRPQRAGRKTATTQKRQPAHRRQGQQSRQARQPAPAGQHHQTLRPEPQAERQSTGPRAGLQRSARHGRAAPQAPSGTPRRAVLTPHRARSQQPHRTGALPRRPVPPPGQPLRRTR
jgi:hypothetical protein